MSDLIKQAVKQKTGLEFEGIKDQWRMLEIGLSRYTEKQIADAMPFQIDAWVNMLGAQLGVPTQHRSLINPALILDRLNLSAPTRSAEGAETSTTATEWLDARETYKLGVEIGTLDERLLNPITDIYLRVFSRMPDEAGYLWWNQFARDRSDWSFSMIEAFMVEDRDKRGAE